MLTKVHYKLKLYTIYSYFNNRIYHCGWKSKENKNKNKLFLFLNEFVAPKADNAIPIPIHIHTTWSKPPISLYIY